MSGKEQQESADAQAPIVPVSIAAASPADDEPATDAAANFKRMAVVAVSIVLFFVLLTVIFILPRYLDTDSPTAQPVTDAAPGPAAEETASEVVAETHTTEEAAELRRASQTLLEEALTLVGELEAHNVTAWAGAEFDAARDTIANGEKAYREQRYAAAQSAYSKAIESLRRIAGRTEEVVAQAVDEGLLGLASMDSAAASRAFEFALSVASDHEEARAGLARAQTLDQVLALVNEAEGYERLGELEQALTRYREALAIDELAPGAESAIARIKQVQLNAQYKRVMSEGFAALDGKQYTKAKSAFERAVKLKPGASEAAGALAQVENEILAQRIAKHLASAIAFEQQEKWTDSARQYRLAARLDADLEGAAASATRAEKRAKLDQQLESTIAKPRRLSDDAVHEEAQAVLKRARSIASAGPRLSAQIDRLDREIKIARTPVAVTLVSDSATEVTLYRVGRLGRFERHSVSVIPGSYVVVGRRDGFRDVRVEFEVSPAKSGAMVTVRCEEKLAFGGS